MIKYNLIYSILAFLILFAGCRTEKVATTKVSEISDLNEPVDKGLIYSLPKTGLYFHVTLVKTTVVPGPYNSHGEELLGLSQVPHSLNTYWDISDIKVEEFSDIDYEHIYAIEPEGKFSIDEKNFTKKGWILPLTKDFNKLPNSNFYSQEKYIDEVYYKDLSVSKIMGKETKTVYKSVWKDSLYAKVPVQESYTLKKNLEQRAKEAANFIYMIREKRFELISGMGDYYPEGKALETAIKEMNATEERYLKLFTGRKFRDTVRHTLYWSPSIKDLKEPDILFRFSSNEGIIDPNMKKGTPVWIEFNKISDTKSLDQYFSNENLFSEKTKFYYRIPARSLVRLKFADETIVRKYIDVFQYGNVIKFPYEYLKDQKIIEYYKEDEE